MLLGCARQWKYQYLDGLRQPSSVDLVVGIAWHAAVEEFLNAQMRTGVGDVREARFALDTAWSRETVKPNINWRRETPESARVLTEKLLDAYVRELAPLIVPVAVEAPFSVPIPGASGWTLDGRIDAVADDGWLIDQKTSGKPYTAEQVDADVQATAYLWAWRELHGSTPPGVAFHVALKPQWNGSTEVMTQEIVTRRTEQQVDWFAGLLREAVKQVEAKAMMPNPGYQWCKTCPALWRDRCMPWRAGAEK